MLGQVWLGATCATPELGNHHSTQPGGYDKPNFAVLMCCSRLRTRFVPQTNACLHSPDLIAWQARWNAYIDELHAVSNVKLEINELYSQASI